MKNVYTVAQVNAYVKNMFTQDFMLQFIYIKGEVSNVKYHTSGHIYFTMKDDKGSITCVMFAGNRKGLGFQMREGQQIIAGGSIDVYERDGKYQLYAREIMLDGSGLLYEKYEKLKQDLADTGMFSPEYKQPIPKYISRLGVVTAPTGAAIQDIINIATRRNPYIQIILYPAKVQGDGAAESIVSGIRALESQKVEVMIVGRGGGSLEDLWAFNEEIVARAIFECSVPVISAVGHETDTTIADFTADLRAATPSAAAELSVFNYADFIGKCFDYNSTFNHIFRGRLNRYKSTLERLQLKLGYLSPSGQIRQKRQLTIELEEKMQDLMQGNIQKKRHLLELYIAKLRGLSPLEKLNQGLSYLSDARGKPIVDVDAVQVQDIVQIHVKNGRIQAQVVEKEKIRRD